MLGTSRPLFLKETKRPTKTPQKLGESWDGQRLKCCKTLLIKGCRGKRRLEGHLKESNHLGNLDDVGGEKIRTQDLNAKRGSIVGNEGFFIKGLNQSRTHGVRILHGSPQVVRTAGYLISLTLLLPLPNGEGSPAEGTRSTTMDE